MPTSVNEWVDYIQTLHHRQMDLSLDRVRTVFQRFMPSPCPFLVITVGGTNGKGSTAELAASIYRGAGYRTAKYTSPHLVKFNERISIDGRLINDEALLDCFRQIDAIRGDISLTYFEFATLVALLYFVDQSVDIAVMEVGLGGRMDAVNVLDTDIAVITSLSLDHTQWLGDTLDKIGYEKAGIARSGKPCIVGMADPPRGLLQHCQKIGANMMLVKRDFDYALSGDTPDWEFSSNGCNMQSLPLPFGQSGVQLTNAALAVKAVLELRDRLPVSEHEIARGIDDATLAARCQILQRRPLIVLDVSHNEDSVVRLVRFLHNHAVPGKTVAVCGMLKDKNIAASLAVIANVVSEWYLATIDNERGAAAHDIGAILLQSDISPSSVVNCYDRIPDAFNAASKTLTADDCLVVFGSFHVAGDILRERENASKTPGSTPGDDGPSQT